MSVFYKQQETNYHNKPYNKSESKYRDKKVKLIQKTVWKLINARSVK